MYEVKEPILGFNEYDQVEVSPFDKFFSTIKFNNDDAVSMNIASAKHLKNFDFTIDDEVVEKLELDENTNYQIYFTLVIQNPSEDSLINLGAPIIINEDKKLIGQFITSDNDFFGTRMVKDLSTL